MQELAGKTAVVTGGASGMGLAFARRFAAAGMHVVIADVEEPALAAAEAEVRDAGEGSDVLAVTTDVAHADQVQALAAAAIERFGRVNVVCNNAGVAGSGLVAGSEVDLADWKWVIDVNLWGVVHGHQAFLPHLLEHGDGHIVNTASVAGHYPGHSAYSASKWAVVGITEGLYLDLKRRRSTVGVSCLCPGFVDTRILSSERNRPEWAAPDALAEPDPRQEATLAMIQDQLSAGARPEDVADLVHDAVVGDTFWIFTDAAMQAGLRGRFDAVLAGTNPDPGSGLPMGRD